MAVVNGQLLVTFEQIEELGPITDAKLEALGDVDYLYGTVLVKPENVAKLWDALDQAIPRKPPLGAEG